MFESNDLEIWNLTSGCTAHVGAQAIFNVVGKLKRHTKGVELWYSLNGGEKKRVFLGESSRNLAPKHFNIDTISCSDLKKDNLLEFYIVDGLNCVQQSIHFSTKFPQSQRPEFCLSFDNVGQPEEIGQVIDGHWRVSADEQGVPCLEIRREDAGYDRLFGIGRHDWTTGYHVDMSFCVTEWTGRNYVNIGLLFKWNPHLAGNGESLPTQWSTGLGYYAADCPGLRLRFGVDVHHDECGRKQGSYVLQEKTFSQWRRWVGPLWNNIVRIGGRPIAQLKCNVRYRFKLMIRSDLYTLEAYEEGNPDSINKLAVPNPPDMLPKGCVGIIACNCAVRIYEYTVTPA